MRRFQVKYIYSACVVIELDNIRILCDPWFTEGIYGGAWFQYPLLECPAKLIGDVDYIFISHLHPDHYDPCFLRDYFLAYGVKPILISERSLAKNFLRTKIKKDLNLEPEIHAEFKINNFHLYFFDSEPESIFSIDSSMLVVDHSSKKALLNLNDCVYSSALSSSISEKLGDSIELVCALVPYSGANSFPHTYLNFEDSESRVLAQKKASNNIHRMNQYLDDLKPSIFIPFAGKYFLGGSKTLVAMNPKRGIPDAVVLRDLFPNCIVPEDGGGSGYDLLNNDLIGEERNNPYSETIVAQYLTKNLRLKIRTSDQSFEELVPFLDCLKARLITLIKKRVIPLLDFEVGFGVVLSRDKFLARSEQSKMFFLPRNFDATKCLDTEYADVSLDEFKTKRYAFILELIDLKKLIAGDLNWNEASIGSLLLNSRRCSYEREFEHSLAFL